MPVKVTDGAESGISESDVKARFAALAARAAGKK